MDRPGRERGRPHREEHDVSLTPYLAGRNAYRCGIKRPSMKPSWMTDAAWSEWRRGWEEAQEEHADAEVARAIGGGAAEGAEPPQHQ